MATSAKPWLNGEHFAGRGWWALTRSWATELTDEQRARLTFRMTCWALIGLLLANLSLLTFVDPDLYHEMALFRECLQLGRMPLEDRFAYTPTIYPSVHHEWGTGAVLYLVAMATGGAGLLATKYLLTAATIALVFCCARLRGARWETLLLLSPVAILAGMIGFTTIRAQVFTLVCLALLLVFMEHDRRGARWWIALWLPVYVAWLNLHAGFVVGAGILVLYTLEQAARKQPMRHLLAILAAMAALVMINPYGWLYYPYLAHGLTMKRPLITEWAPLWTAGPILFRAWLVSVVVFAYAASRLGWRQAPGLVIVAVTALLACKHTRHVSLYCVVWLAYVPAMLDQTALGTRMAEFWQRRQAFVLALVTLLAGFTVVRAAMGEPWRLTVPTTQSQARMGGPVYPAGVVRYLQQIGFRGNLMTPFVPGGFLAWHLTPDVRVSLDGRYEVAYQPGILEQHVAFYDAEPGWRDTLAAWPTDLVLLARRSPVARPLQEQTDWRLVYQDNDWLLVARPDLALPEVDARGLTVPVGFP